MKREINKKSVRLKTKSKVKGARAKLKKTLLGRPKRKSHKRVSNKVKRSIFAWY